MSRNGFTVASSNKFSKKYTPIPNLLITSTLSNSEKVVLSYLLMMRDTIIDKHGNRWVFYNFKIAEQLRMNDETVRIALQRLRNLSVLTTSNGGDTLALNIEALESLQRKKPIKNTSRTKIQTTENPGFETKLTTENPGFQTTENPGLIITNNK